MIVVTGAGGQLGRAVIESLLHRVPAERVAASVRDPHQARDLEERGVRVRRGDFTEPASLAHAFEGASRVLVVSSNTDDGPTQNVAAIEAAIAAGAGRVFYTSHMGTSATSAFPPMHVHAATEEALGGAGIAYTSLRNGFYASTVPMLLGDAATTGLLRVPEDGPVAWTTHADLADVTALALADDGTALDGATPPLTGPAAVTMADVAALTSDLGGREVRHEVVTDAAYRADLLGRGLPEPAADMLLGLFVASRRGDFAPADPTLARLIGRPATPLADVLRPLLSPL